MYALLLWDPDADGPPIVVVFDDAREVQELAVAAAERNYRQATVTVLTATHVFNQFDAEDREMAELGY